MSKVVDTYWNPSRKTVSDEELLAFAKRLHTRMLELGLTQSDLARKAFGETTEGGVKRVKDRDKVSLYLRGKGLPGADKMKKLAKALGLKIEELAPRITPPTERVSSPKGSETPTPSPSFQQGVSLESGKNGSYYVLYVHQVKVKAEAVPALMAAIEQAKVH